MYSCAYSIDVYPAIRTARASFTEHTTERCLSSCTTFFRGGSSVFFFVIVSLSCPNCPTNLSAIFFLEVLQAHFSNWKWTWHLACWQLQRNGSEIELGLSTTNYVRVLDSMTSSLHIYVRSPSTVTIKQTRINPINHTYPTVFNSA